MQSGGFMKIKKVGILGAGAVGSYVIWGLSEKQDIQLGLIAQGERAERLKKGILINDIKYDPEVWQSCDDLDLLIVCLKYGALEGALDTIQEIVNEKTIVMSLMNGVDSEEIIASRIGQDHILYSLIKVASHKEGTGFYFDPDTTIGIVLGGKNEYVDDKKVESGYELKFENMKETIPTATYTNFKLYTYLGVISGFIILILWFIKKRRV